MAGASGTSVSGDALDFFSSLVVSRLFFVGYPLISVFGPIFSFFASLIDFVTGEAGFALDLF